MKEYDIAVEKVKKYRQYLKDCADDEDFEMTSVVPFEEWKKEQKEVE